MKIVRTFSSLQLIQLNLAVALGYFVLGYFGAMLNIPPSSASPVWPPTGLALATTLVYGIVASPGVFFGALAIKLYIFIDFSTPASIIPTLITATISSLGSCVQAIFGAYLINHFLGKHDPLTEDSKIIRFFFLGGPVSCIIASTIGISTIFFQGFITIDAIPISWITWWVGDCIGVIIFTPIILAFIARPKKLWKIRRKTVSYPLLGMFVLVACVFLFSQKQEAARIALVFERQVNSFHSKLNSDILRHVELNQVLKGFFDSSELVTNEEFNNFTRPMLSKSNYIQALEWIAYIPSHQRKQFESPEHANLNIREPDRNNKMIRSAERPEYFPITYVQPRKQNQRALGFDVSTNPKALSALLEAKNTGKTIITEPLQLVQDLQKKTGFVLYAPVYDKNKNNNASTDKINTLKGFTAVVFRMEDKINSVLSDFPDVQLFIEIKDQGQQLYNNFPDSNSASLNLLSLQKTSQIRIANRVWTVSYQPSEDFYHNQVSWTIWWLFLGGFIVTSLTGIGLLMLIGRTLLTEELVKIRTRDLAKSEERWQFALDGSRDGVWDWNVMTGEVFFSSQFKEMLGYTYNEYINNIDEWASCTHPDDMKRIYDEVKKCFDNNTYLYENEHRMICKDGSHKWILARGKVVSWTDDNQPLRMIGTNMDLTDRKQVDQQLQLSSRVFSETKEGIMITDASGIIVEVNQAFKDITGYSREESIGQNPNILNSGRQSPSFYDEMWKTVVDQGHWQGELWNRKKDGSLYAELITISSITDENNIISHYVSLFTDITHSKKQQEALALMAHYDVLTQLPNRVLLADRFFQAKSHSSRKENLVAVCFLDLDNFKPVNDNYGHETGDKLLVEVAKRIKTNIRNEDTASRQGGDEFVLLLIDIDSFSQCEQLLNRIIEAIALPYFIDDLTLSITASIGVSLYPIDKSDLDTLMRHADQAMYQAKIAGRNCYSLFNAEKDQQIIKKHVQLKEIRKALSNNEFCLYYQPKVNMVTGKVYGAEALIRWLHPENGLIPPFKFLPIIEGTELEFLIGKWVINESLNQLERWKEQQIDLEISINISSFHLQQPSFIPDLDHALSLHPSVYSKSLQLEILESSALGDLHSVSSIINSCINTLGITIALDDFGTGYSSLTHLRNLPAKIIKIDQSFVRDVLDDPNDYAIVEGIIGLANAFNREVIAEGVESTEIGQMLIAMGCNDAQGYAISKPMPADEFQDWLVQYTPNQTWQNFENKDLSTKESKINVLKLTVNRWARYFETNIQSTTDNVEYWPVMDINQCHCGIWIKRENQDNLFDSDWLYRLQVEHNALRHIANFLKKKHQSGEVDLARDGLSEFKKRFEKMTEVLAEYE